MEPKLLPEPEHPSMLEPGIQHYAQTSPITAPPPVTSAKQPGYPPQSPVVSPPPLAPQLPVHISNPEAVQFFLGVIFTILVVIGGAGLMFWSAQTPKVASSSVISKKTAVLPLIPNRARFSLEVLNGGVTNVASAAAKKLTDLGYRVVKVGDVALNRRKSELFLSETATPSSQLLEKDLQDLFGIATVSGTFKDSSASARLILVEN